LKQGRAKPLDGPKEIGSGTLQEEDIALPRLIDLLNDRSGTDFNQSDQYFFDQITELATNDERLQQAAKVNPADKFALVFGNMLETFMLERMDQNEAIVARFMNDREFQKAVAARLSDEAYERLGGGASPPKSYPKLSKARKGQ